MHVTRAAHTSRNSLEQDFLQLFLHRLKVIGLESGSKQPDPTGEIEPYAAGGNDAPVVRIERGNSTDGKPIAPVCSGHRIGGADNTPQGRHIDDLLVDLVVHVPNQLLRGKDHPRYPHLAGGRNLPCEVAIS